MRDEVSLTVATAADMRSLGRSLATVLRAGDLVILSGGLGAGKTTLTQGIGDGLGVRGPITSPTFVIARVHPARWRRSLTSMGRAGAGLPLVHVDAYRLGSALELDDLDLDADTETSVTVVECGARGWLRDWPPIGWRSRSRQMRPATPADAWPAGRCKRGRQQGRSR